MEVAKATPAAWGPEGGAFVDLGLRASSKRSTPRLLREGDLKLLRGRSLSSRCPGGWEAVSLSAYTNPSLLIFSSSASERSPTQP